MLRVQHIYEALRPHDWIMPKKEEQGRPNETAEALNFASDLGPVPSPARTPPDLEPPRDIRMSSVPTAGASQVPIVSSQSQEETSTSSSPLPVLLSRTAQATPKSSPSDSNPPSPTPQYSDTGVSSSAPARTKPTPVGMCTGLKETPTVDCPGPLPVQHHAGHEHCSASSERRSALCCPPTPLRRSKHEEETPRPHVWIMPKKEEQGRPNETTEALNFASDLGPVPSPARTPPDMEPPRDIRMSSVPTAGASQLPMVSSQSQEETSTSNSPLPVLLSRTTQATPKSSPSDSNPPSPTPQYRDTGVSSSAPARTEPTPVGMCTGLKETPTVDCQGPLPVQHHAGHEHCSASSERRCALCCPPTPLRRSKHEEETPRPHDWIMPKKEEQGRPNETTEALNFASDLGPVPSPARTPPDLEPPRDIRMSSVPTAGASQLPMVSSQSQEETSTSISPLPVLLSRTTQATPKSSPPDSNPPSPTPQYRDTGVSSSTPARTEPTPVGMCTGLKETPTVDCQGPLPVQVSAIGTLKTASLFVCAQSVIT
ncbi:hypothetical protein V5799_016850 [Amblyomma americanum]|uniref:Uncharacterized protein n=1 Tax=Amblyomma americanum TaxID=6943 RepID=A0AAQ4F3T2_AMBAM